MILKSSRGFTLVEILIVITILGVLMVTLLITLNPAEAQKKSRDVTRKKDMATLQTLIEQYLSDGNEPICNDNDGCSSDIEADWATVTSALRTYSTSIPADPANGNTRTNAYINASDEVAYGSKTMKYVIKMDGTDYHITAYQESKTNAKSTKEGGYCEQVVEILSNPDRNLLDGNCP